MSSWHRRSKTACVIRFRPTLTSRQPIWHASPDLVAPNIQAAVGYKLQAITVFGKTLLKFLSRALVNEEVHVDIHFSQVLKILERNESLASESRRGMLGDQ